MSVGTVVAYDLRSYQRALLNDLSTQAELVGHMTSAALAFDDPRLARENLALLRSRPVGARGRHLRRQRRAVRVLPGAGRAAPPSRPHPGQGTGHVRDGDDLVLFKPIVENGDLLGTVYLRSHEPADGAHARLPR